MDRDVVFIGAASGWGAPDNGCGDGPHAMVARGYLPCFQQHDRSYCPPIHILQPQDDDHHAPLQLIQQLCLTLADLSAKQLQSGHFPVVLGGDHSCAIGTWSGVHRISQAKGDLGMIWVDAHMDSHTPDTSHSGAIHGMPLAVLLGQGDHYLTKLNGTTPSLSAEHVCLLGVRSYESEEQQLLDRLGVRVITMREIQQIGFAKAWQLALKIAASASGGFGISIDLDAIDPNEAPGVGSPEQNGIHANELLSALHHIHHRHDLLALEITEYNPYRDHNNATARLMAELIHALLSEEQAP